MKNQNIKNDFKTKFIIAKTIFNELKSAPSEAKQNLELIEILAQSIINLLNHNSKDLIKTTSKILYENIKQTQKLFLHHSEKQLQEFNYGLNKEIYNREIHFYKKNKYFELYQKITTRVLKGFAKSTIENKYREKLFHYHKHHEFPDWAKEQSEILKLSGFIFYNHINIHKNISV